MAALVSWRGLSGIVQQWQIATWDRMANRFEQVGIFAALLTLSLLSGAGIALAADPAPRQIVAGLQASLVVDRIRTINGTDGPHLKLTLTNVGQQPVRIFNRLEIRWPGTNSAANVGLAIIRADGTPYEPSETISDLTRGPRAEEFEWLAPGRSVFTGPIPVQGTRGIKDAGRYTITATYSNHFVSYVTADGIVHKEPDVWTGSIVSNAVTVEVAD